MQSHHDTPADHHDGDPGAWRQEFEHDVCRDFEEYVGEEEDHGSNLFKLQLANLCYCTRLDVCLDGHTGDARTLYLCPTRFKSSFIPAMAAFPRFERSRKDMTYSVVNSGTRR